MFSFPSVLQTTMQSLSMKNYVVEETNKYFTNMKCLKKPAEVTDNFAKLM